MIQKQASLIMIVEVSVSLVVPSLSLMLVCPVDGAKRVIPSVLSSLALLIPSQAMATALLPVVPKAPGTCQWKHSAIQSTTESTTIPTCYNWYHWCYGCGTN